MAIAAVSTATMVLAARPASNLFLTPHRAPHRARWVFTPFAVSSSSSSKPSRAPILYSKSGCCLCDGLKEKLQAAFLLSGPDSLHDVDLQVRAITSNPEWERAYGMRYLFWPEYYLMALRCLPTDADSLCHLFVETLPRLSPRLGVELVQKKIATAFKH